jgi:hypothetical protein
MPRPGVASPRRHPGGRCRPESRLRRQPVDPVQAQQDPGRAAGAPGAGRWAKPAVAAITDHYGVAAAAAGPAGTTEHCGFAALAGGTAVAQQLAGPAAGPAVAKLGGSAGPADPAVAKPDGVAAGPPVPPVSPTLNPQVPPAPPVEYPNRLAWPPVLVVLYERRAIKMMFGG